MKELAGNNPDDARVPSWQWMDKTDPVAAITPKILNACATSIPAIVWASPNATNGENPLTARLFM